MASPFFQWRHHIGFSTPVRFPTGAIGHAAHLTFVQIMICPSQGDEWADFLSAVIPTTQDSFSAHLRFDPSSDPDDDAVLRVAKLTAQGHSWSNNLSRCTYL